MESDALREAELEEQLRRQLHFEQMMTKLLNKRLKVAHDAEDEKSHRLYAIKTLKLPKKKRLKSPEQKSAKQEVENASKKINQLEKIGVQYADFFDKIKCHENSPVSEQQEAAIYTEYVAGLKISNSSKNILNLKASYPFRINLDEFENKERNVQKYYALLNPVHQLGSQTERKSLNTPSQKPAVNSTDSNALKQRTSSGKPKLTLTNSSNTQRIVRTFNRQEASDESNLDPHTHHSLVYQKVSQLPDPVTSRSPTSSSNLKWKTEKPNPFNTFIKRLKFSQKKSYNPTQSSETRTKTDKNSEHQADFNKTFEFSGRGSTKPSPATFNRLSQTNGLTSPSGQMQGFKYKMLGNTVGERKFVQEANYIERKVAGLLEQCDSNLGKQTQKVGIVSRTHINPLPIQELDNQDHPREANHPNQYSICTDSHPFSSNRDKKRSASPKERIHPFIIKAIKDRISSNKVQAIIANRSSVNLDDLVKGVFQKPGTYFGELDSQGPKREKTTQPVSHMPKQMKSKKVQAESKKAEETRLYANLLHNFMTFGNSAVSKKEATSKITEFLNNQPNQFNPENLKKMAMQRGFYITTMANKDAPSNKKSS